MTQGENATNEASRDPLRLPFICWPIGAQMAMSCLWQDRNYEGDDIGTVCDGEMIRKVEPEPEAKRQ